MLLRTDKKVFVLSKIRGGRGILSNFPFSSHSHSFSLMVIDKIGNGEINNFIGISDTNPYEEPLSPDIEVDTSEASISEVVQDILNNLDKMGLYEMKINE